MLDNNLPCSISEHAWLAPASYLSQRVQGQDVKEAHKQQQHS